jgi:hypothetical protein
VPEVMIVTSGVPEGPSVTILAKCFEIHSINSTQVVYQGTVVPRSFVCTTHHLLEWILVSTDVAVIVAGD